MSVATCPMCVPLRAIALHTASRIENQSVALIFSCVDAEAVRLSTVASAAVAPDTGAGERLSAGAGTVLPSSNSATFAAIGQRSSVSRMPRAWIQVLSDAHHWARAYAQRMAADGARCF